MKKFVLLGIFAIAMLAIPGVVMADVPVSGTYGATCGIVAPGGTMGGPLHLGDQDLGPQYITVTSNLACWQVTIQDTNGLPPISNGGKMRTPTGNPPPIRTLKDVLKFYPLQPLPCAIASPPPAGCIPVPVNGGNLWATGGLNMPSGVVLPLTLEQFVEGGDVAGPYADTLTLTCSQPTTGC